MGLRLFVRKLLSRRRETTSVPRPEEVIRQLDGYLNRVLSWKEVSDWALQVVIHKRHREPWNEDLEEAIFALLSLHDGPDVSWAPSREELIAHSHALSRLVRSQNENHAST